MKYCANCSASGRVIARSQVAPATTMTAGPSPNLSNAMVVPSFERTFSTDPPLQSSDGRRRTGARFRRRVEEDEDRTAGREPSLDEAARTLGLTMEEANADREDLVEATISQVEVLEGRDEELSLASLDVRHVSTRGRLDHLRRAVYRGEMAFFEALAHERRRDPVPAPDLEHPVTRPDVQLLDYRSQP